ncbi:MAG TPA: hypothetical protein V6D07_00040 [Trichocoleus sp.]
MKAPIRKSKRRPEASWKRMLDRANAGLLPWPWMLITLLLHAAAGLILGAFPVPYWAWTLGLASVLLQAIALPGGRTLSKFRWFPATALSLLGIAGAATLTVAISIGLNFAGSADLTNLSPSQVIFEVLKFSMLALALGVLCSAAAAETGDFLSARFKRIQATLLLAATCILGLALGGLFGLLIASP